MTNELTLLAAWLRARYHTCISRCSACIEGNHNDIDGSESNGTNVTNSNKFLSSFDAMNVYHILEANAMLITHNRHKPGWAHHHDGSSSSSSSS